MMLVVRDCGTKNAANIDAAVAVEGPVLGSEGRLHHPWRDVVKGYHDPVVALLADVGEQLAMPVVDQGVLLQLVRGQAADGGQGPDGLGGDGGDAHQRHQQHDHQAKDHGAPEVGAAALPPPVHVALRAPTSR